MLGCAFGLWISFGSYISKKNWNMLPTIDSNCTNMVEDAFHNGTFGNMESTLATAAMIFNSTVTVKSHGVYMKKPL